MGTAALGCLVERGSTNYARENHCSPFKVNIPTLNFAKGAKFRMGQPPLVGHSQDLDLRLSTNDETCVPISRSVISEMAPSEIAQ